MTAAIEQQPQQTRQRGRGATILTRAAATAICAALGTVIIAPIVLSSQDLVRWATSPTGLGLAPHWAWLVFVALDSVAAVCVGMVTVAAWRGESGGAFHGLTWLFSAGSAVANYRHGVTTPARDDQYFFPAMSLAGPLLLDVTLARIRRWVRIDAETQLAARPRFGLRWLPGVGFRETLRAGKAALREGLARPADAIAYVREREALTGMTPSDAVHLAVQALAVNGDPVTLYRVRQWLVARGVVVNQEQLTAVPLAVPAIEAPAPARLHAVPTGHRSAPAARVRTGGEADISEAAAVRLAAETYPGGLVNGWYKPLREKHGRSESWWRTRRPLVESEIATRRTVG